jgi:hypothetical protein
MGAGTQLIDAANATEVGALELWCFQANQRARCFSRHRILMRVSARLHATAAPEAPAPMMRTSTISSVGRGICLYGHVTVQCRQRHAIVGADRVPRRATTSRPAPAPGLSDRAPAVRYRVRGTRDRRGNSIMLIPLAPRLCAARRRKWRRVALGWPAPPSNRPLS